MSIAEFFQFIMHLNNSLPQLIDQYHSLVYVILFIVIFCETGLVVTPFLPGDSLIFASGTVAAMGKLNPFVIFPLIFCASVLGDNSNYRIGHFLRDSIRKKKELRFIKKENLDKTHAFYQKHGGGAVILAKFMPIIRTFSPFVAGIGAMTYKRFFFFDLFAGFVWVSLFSVTGFFFGQVSFVKNHFTLVELAIVVISVTPAFVIFLKSKLAARKTERA